MADPAPRRVTILGHPLLKHKLTIMRDKNTAPPQFRQLLNEISVALAYEVTRHEAVVPVTVTTPVCVTDAGTALAHPITFVSILRAGNGILEGMLEMVPSARVGHIGIFRDPETLRPVQYYCKLPTVDPEGLWIIIDPMLATGYTASLGIQRVKDHGARRVVLVTLLAAPNGVDRINADHPDVDVFTVELDRELNEHGYIVPGLGDAGDRLFGTVH